MALLFTFAAPFAFAALTTSAALAAILSFLAVSLVQTINELARDLEDPFHYDPNQVPVSQMCYRLNERLLAISKTRRPIAFTDDRCLEPPHFMPSGMVRFLHLTSSYVTSFVMPLATSATCSTSVCVQHFSTCGDV